MIVLGGGNTAMDCCRSSRRLGGEDVKVVVRSGFEEMKASPWEKEDAMHEDIPIFNYLVPKEFTHDNGTLTGVTFEKVKAVRDAKGRRDLVPTGEPDQHVPCDDVLVAVGQENAFPWIERDMRHRIRPMGHAQGRYAHHGVDPSESVLRRRCGIWPEKHHLGGRARPRGRDLDRPGVPRRREINVRPPPQVAVSSQKMGIHEWSYDNEISLDKRYRVPHRDKVISLRDIKAEVELGFDLDLALKEAERCLNCDVQTVFTGQLCIECDACVDICPMDCITFTAERRGGRAAEATERAGEQPHAGSLYRQ